MFKTELTSMVMIQNKETGKVLVQDRVKSWEGVSFPGGHVEADESFVDCAIREIKEETGLDIKNLKSCGIIHWLNNKTFDRYLVFLYKTNDFSGMLIEETNEGKVFWTDIKILEQIKQSNNGFHKYLTMFLEDNLNEAFGLWNDDEPWEIVYK